jgi:hypothetical protein
MDPHLIGRQDPDHKGPQGGKTQPKDTYLGMKSI